MTTKKAKKETTTNVAVVETVKRQELVLEGDPEQQLEFAQKASKALMKVVGSKKNKVIINGKQYLEYGDWQTLARFYGATVGVEWTRSIEKGTSIIGYEARAVVYRGGEVISAAEAMCTKDERNWKNRDEFMLKSMAQTRASAKALRNAVGWVAELAGYSSTPAEEMDGVKKEAPPKKEDIFDKAKRILSQMTDVDMLVEHRDKVLASKYTKKQKDELITLIDARIAQLTPKTEADDIRYPEPEELKK